MACTAYELYQACESMRDLDELYAGLGMEDEAHGDVVREVCGAGLSFLCMTQALIGLNSLAPQTWP